MNSLPFVVRVYGVYLHPEFGYLVSDEWINGRLITKFPGGGLEFGEGTRDCLQREMMEETGKEFVILDHLYTTDFFVPSAFDEKLQVISVYYRMEPSTASAFEALVNASSAMPDISNPQVFRWIPPDQMEAGIFTLVIDKRVGSMLRLSAEQPPS